MQQKHHGLGRAETTADELETFGVEETAEDSTDFKWCIKLDYRKWNKISHITRLVESCYEPYHWENKNVIKLNDHIIVGSKKRDAEKILRNMRH